MDTPDPRPVPCCTDTLGMPIPCQHRPVSPPSELTALAELLDWVDLIDAPGTVLADLVQRSRIELDAARGAPQADEGLQAVRAAIEAMPPYWHPVHQTGQWRRDVLAVIDNLAAAPVPAGLDVERALALVYAEGYGKGAPVAVAKVCDETLDRSGALLGRIRERARALSQLPEDAPEVQA